MLPGRRDVQRRLVVPADPVRIGAGPEQELRSAELPAVARLPEGARDLVVRRRPGGELCRHPVVEPERGGVPELRLRTALDEPARGFPLAESDRVGERRAAADHGSWRLDIGACVEQRIEHLDVVAARRPVQRRLGMRAAVERGIDVGARLDQRRHGGRAVREVAGPVGGDVQQRAAAALAIAHALRAERRVVAQQPAQHLDLARADRRAGGPGQRLGVGDRHHPCAS